MIIGKLKLWEKRVIGYDGDGGPLLIRRILFRLPSFGIYLHHLLRSDYDRALHDHPWSFVSLVLWGGYTEIHDQTGNHQQISAYHRPGSILVRPAKWRHRFVLEKPAWTLVFVGKRRQPWGFYLKDGWCWWRKHNANLGICEEEVIHRDGSD